MAFVLLVVLLIIFGAIKAGDRGSDIIHERELNDKYEADKKARAEWELKVTDIKLEEELYNKVRAREPEIMLEIEETIRNDIRSFGGRWYAPETDPKLLTIYAVTSERIIERGKNIGDHYATRILMANRGKLRRHDAVMGIDLNGIGHEPWEIKKCEELKYEHVEWINSKLKEHGIDYPLIINGVSNNYYPWKEKGNVNCHTAMWAPEVSWIYKEKMNI